MKKSKNGSIRGSPQKTHRSFEMVSDNCQKGRKKEWLATDSTLNHKDNHLLNIKPQILGKNGGIKVVHRIDYVKLLVILYNLLD